METTLRCYLCNLSSHLRILLLVCTWANIEETTHWNYYTFSELIKRLRVLTLTLLPVEVDPVSINEPTSRIITPKVIYAYRAAAGDFVEAVSFRELHASIVDA